MTRPQLHRSGTGRRGTVGGAVASPVGRRVWTLACIVAVASGCSGGGNASPTSPTGPDDAVAPTAGVTSVPPSASTSAVPPTVAPTPNSVAPVTTVDTGLAGCPQSARAAVADKATQQFWLCADGVSITEAMPMTTASAAYGLPPVGTYEVFARDDVTFGINGERLNRFVAFYTTPKGNRIAFHEVVDQDPASLGQASMRGASSGCFRVSEADSRRVWDYLQIGDPVVILTN